MTSQYGFDIAQTWEAVQHLVGYANDRMATWLAMLAFVGVTGTLLALILYVLRRIIAAMVITLRMVSAAPSQSGYRMWI